MANSDKNTKINPKHYIGKLADNETLFIIGSMILSGALAVGTGAGIYDTIHEEPDTIGTIEQDTTYKALTASIENLDKQQTNIEIAQKQYEIDLLKGDTLKQDSVTVQNKISSLQKEFALNSYGVLADLYLHGTSGTEADISEAQVLELSELFTKKIAPPSEFGITITRDKVAYLDEARIDMAENKDNDNLNYMAQFQKIDSIMRNKNETDQVISATPAMLSGIGLIFFLLLGVQDRLSNWSHEKKRIPKRSKKSQNNH